MTRLTVSKATIVAGIISGIFLIVGALIATCNNNGSNTNNGNNNSIIDVDGNNNTINFNVFPEYDEMIRNIKILITAIPGLSGDEKKRQS
jgi:hypothetical protein